MKSALGAAATMNSARPAFPKVAEDIHEGQTAIFVSNSNVTAMESGGVHTLASPSPSGVVAITSWTLRENDNMVTTVKAYNDRPPSSNYSQAHDYIAPRGNGESAPVVTFPLTVAMIETLTGNKAPLLDGQHHMLLDACQLAEGDHNAKDPTTNAYVPPSVLAEASEQTLTVILHHFFTGTMNISHLLLQSSSLVDSLRSVVKTLNLSVGTTAAPRKLVLSEGTADTYRLYDLESSQVWFGKQQQTGLSVLSDPFTGKGLLVLTVPSASRAIGSKLGGERPAAAHVTDNVLRIGRQLSALSSPDVNTYFEAAGTTRAANQAQADVVKRSQGGAGLSYVSPSVAGGRVGGRHGNKEGKAAGGRMGRVDDEKAAPSTLSTRKYRAKVKAAIAGLPQNELVKAEEERKRKQREQTQRCRENKKAKKD